MAVPALGIGHEGAKKQERNMQFIVLGLVASGGALRVQNRSAATQLDAIATFLHQRSTVGITSDRAPVTRFAHPAFRRGTAT